MARSGSAFITAAGNNVGHVCNVPRNPGTLQTCPTFLPADLRAKIRPRRLGRNDKDPANSANAVEDLDWLANPRSLGTQALALTD
jgi:hypothetical protein